MARAVTRTWYRIVLARPGGVPFLVAAEGEHLGVAIATAEKFAATKGEANPPFAIAVERATEAVPLGESVGKQHVVALSEDVSATPVFRWPRGVLPRLGHPIAASRGYVVHPDPKMLVVEAQTDATHVSDLFLGLLEKLPSADNLEIRVLDHFENSATANGPTMTDVWLTSRVDGRRILGFLDEQDVELIENGHVELSIYIRAHKATLRLTEHKTVVWLSDGDALRADVLRWFAELAIPPATDFATVSSGPHFHYRAAKSKDRKKLAEHLYRQRLRRVDKVAARTPEADGARDTDG